MSKKVLILASSLMCSVAIGNARADDVPDTTAIPDAILERFNALEQRVNSAEQRAAQAEADLKNLKAQQAGQNNGVATTGASPDGQNQATQANPQTSVDQRLQKDEAQLSSLGQALKGATGFEFTGYARSGILVNGAGKGSHQTNDSYMTPAGAVDGAIGRLGNEDATYLEMHLGKRWTFDDGAWAHFEFMMANGDEDDNPWPSNSTFVTRELFSEIGDLPSMPGALRHAVFWAGKRFDHDNFDLHTMDTDYVFLAGTGGGVYNVAWTDKFKNSFSIYARNFGSYSVASNNAGYSFNDGLGGVTEEYIATANNFYGNWQLMVNAFSAPDNNQRANLPGTTTPTPGITGQVAAGTANSTTLADSGFQGVLAYHDKSFYGLASGSANDTETTAVQFGTGLGAEAHELGADGNLGKDAKTVRLTTYGVVDLQPTWHFAPAIMVQQSKDRYLKGDDYKFTTVNLRLMEDITRSFALQYEATYQYADLRTADYTGNYTHGGPGSGQSANGNFYKLTFAPTVHLGETLFGLMERPQLRIFATWMNWDKGLEKFSNNDALGLQTGGSYAPLSTLGTSGGTWTFGTQMEVWF